MPLHLYYLLESCRHPYLREKKKGEEQRLTAQPPTLAVFPPWGSSEGAGSTVLTRRKSR